MDTNVLTLMVLGVIAVGLVIYSVWPHKAEERDAVKRRLSGRRGVDEKAEITEKARTSAAEDLVKKAAPMLSRLVMPTSDTEQTNLRVKLAMAGFRQPQAQTTFLASKSVLAVVGLILGAVIGITSGQSMLMLMGVIAFGAGVGLMLPDGWLAMAVNARKEKLRYGLPDTLDLLVVSVESGLALDAAIKRVAEEMATVHPELSEEMRIATAEAQMGIPRSEALENMARRAGVDEMRSLVSVIMQAEKFGTSISRALRNQADSLRTKRRQAAEERAQKTAVKLMMPLVLFIFPAMGVVLGGPAVINIIKTLGEHPIPGVN